jgi:hypothetical protein
VAIAGRDVEGGPSCDPALLPSHGPDPALTRITMARTHDMVLADIPAMLCFAAADPAAQGPVGTIGYWVGERRLQSLTA